MRILRVVTVPMSFRWLLKGQLNFLTRFYDITAVSSHGDDLIEVEKREKVNVKSIEMSRDISPFKDLKAIRCLYRLIKTEKPFLVHSITPKAGFVSMVAARLAGVPYRLHTVTGLRCETLTGLKKYILILAERITGKCATKLIPEGYGVQKKLIQYNIIRNPLSPLANGSVNGIDMEYFKLDSNVFERSGIIKSKYNISKDEFIFLFIGRIVKDKGINELIEAFHVISESDTNVRLFLVGKFEENLDPVSDRTIRLINENPKIELVGFQEDVRPWFAMCDVFVFPSYREGLPNVVLQAGAMERASIVTDIIGSNEIIEDGVNGLIIPPKDVSALRDAMLKLKSDIGLRKKLASHARKMVVEKYDQKIVWKALLNEYKSMVPVD